MAKTIYIKLTKAGSKSTTFNISDEYGNIIDENVSKDLLVAGVAYDVDDSVLMVTLSSTGNCTFSKTLPISTISAVQIAFATFKETRTACLWGHLTDTSLYNNFYGNIEPYILEYPFSYNYQDEILQNVKDYTKSYRYISDGTGVYTYNDRIEVDEYFSSAVVYNNQQSSGILTLVPKPRNNMKEYMRYPIYATEDKKIIYTKSDNFYQFNTFFDVVKDKSIPLFLTSCSSLSIDKEVNQSNMIYTQQSFKKSLLRAKDCKIRLSLTDKSDLHLVSQFIIQGTQLSYK